jgi:hypothetical protein
MLAPYLPDATLGTFLREMLDRGAETARPAFLAALSAASGAPLQFYRSTPAVGDNRLAPGPLERLGGSHAVHETVEAIRDVCAWWP